MLPRAEVSDMETETLLIFVKQSTNPAVSVAKAISPRSWTTKTLKATRKDQASFSSMLANLEASVLSKSRREDNTRTGDHTSIVPIQKRVHLPQMPQGKGTKVLATSPVIPSQPGEAKASNLFNLKYDTEHQVSQSSDQTSGCHMSSAEACRKSSFHNNLEHRSSCLIIKYCFYRRG